MGNNPSVQKLCQSITCTNTEQVVVEDGDLVDSQSKPVQEVSNSKPVLEQIDPLEAYVMANSNAAQQMASHLQ